MSFLRQLRIKFFWWRRRLYWHLHDLYWKIKGRPAKPEPKHVNCRCYIVPVEDDKQ